MCLWLYLHVPRKPQTNHIPFPPSTTRSAPHPHGRPASASTRHQPIPSPSTPDADESRVGGGAGDAPRADGVIPRATQRISESPSQQHHHGLPLPPSLTSPPRIRGTPPPRLSLPLPLPLASLPPPLKRDRTAARSPAAQVGCSPPLPLAQPTPGAQDRARGRQAGKGLTRAAGWDWWIGNRVMYLALPLIQLKPA